LLIYGVSSAFLCESTFTLCNIGGTNILCGTVFAMALITKLRQSYSNQLLRYFENEMCCRLLNTILPIPYNNASPAHSRAFTAGKTKPVCLFFRQRSKTFTTGVRIRK